MDFHTFSILSHLNQLHLSGISDGSRVETHAWLRPYACIAWRFLCNSTESRSGVRLLTTVTWYVTGAEQTTPVVWGHLTAGLSLQATGTCSAAGPAHCLVPTLPRILLITAWGLHGLRVIAAVTVVAYGEWRLCRHCDVTNRQTQLQCQNCQCQ